MVLKKVPRIIGPQLLRALMEIGAGEKILLANANFPIKDHQVFRLDGTSVFNILEALSILMTFSIEEHFPDEELKNIRTAV